MKTNILYILITALRDRLFIGILSLVLLATYVAAVLGGTALVETQEMTLVYAAGASRLILMVGLVVFICFHVRNAFDTKEIDVILSRPISRGNLVFSYWLGFMVVGSALILPILAIMAMLGIISHPGFAWWSLSLFLEVMLIVAVALFSALTLKSAVSSVLASLAFYTLSRMMGFFIATAHSGALFSHKTWNFLARYSLEAVSAIVPRLDFYAKTQWLVYNIKDFHEVRLFVLQTAIFAPLLIGAAMFDFRRKEF